MSKNNQNVKLNAIADALVYNNRFANVKMSGEQIGVENFAQWKTLLTNLHRQAYTIYATCENQGLKVEDSTIDKSPIYDGIKALLAAVGEVKGHKLYVNEESVIAIVGYAGRRANADSPELQYCNSRINGLRKEIKMYEALNVADTDYKAKRLAEMNEQLEVLLAEKSTLLKTVDMRYKQPTMTSENSFRLEVEHFIARAIVGQLAKSLEELDAEAEARKAARKARKSKKANA